MKPLIVALDVETDRQAVSLVRRLKPYVDLFKIGPVLFLKYGRPLIEELRDLGAEIFLDMKFHDIPSVVRKAIERAAEWGVYSATIHISGGKAMLREAASASPRPKLWGVTVLTSLDSQDLRRLGIQRSMPAQVQRLAQFAKASGLEGVIAAVREAGAIKKLCGPGFQVVTPGIRMGKAADDQKRTETPSKAVASGADFFVMGRPIVEAAHSIQFVKGIYSSLPSPVEP